MVSPKFVEPRTLSPDKKPSGERETSDANFRFTTPGAGFTTRFAKRIQAGHVRASNEGRDHAKPHAIGGAGRFAAVRGRRGIRAGGEGEGHANQCGGHHDRQRIVRGVERECDQGRATAGYTEVKGLRFKDDARHPGARGGNDHPVRIEIDPTTGNAYQADASSRLHENIAILRRG